MMTIVTHVHLKEGAGRDWAMRTRLLASKKGDVPVSVEFEN
jgi:hypothetical protein